MKKKDIDKALSTVVFNFQNIITNKIKKNTAETTVIDLRTV